MTSRILTAMENPDSADLNELTRLVTGHYDGDQPGALHFYREHMRHGSPAARDRHYLIVGPWDHAGTRTPNPEVGGLTFGATLDGEAVIKVPKETQTGKLFRLNRRTREVREPHRTFACKGVIRRNREDLLDLPGERRGHPRRTGEHLGAGDGDGDRGAGPLLRIEHL